MNKHTFWWQNAIKLPQKNILRDSVFPLRLNLENYFSLESLAYLGNNSKYTLDASFILYTVIKMFS